MRIGPQGTPVEWFEEETFFFRLSAYQDKLLAHYEKHPDFILPPERRNEVVSFVKGGLEDLSVSRTTLDWGIPVPGAPEHVMYVWVDALTNYITARRVSRRDGAALALLAGRCARHRQGHPALPRRLLAGVPDVGRHRAAQARLLAWLRAQPRREDVEVGRQRGRSVRPGKAYGVDQVRYFFLREVAFGQDGNYSHEAIVNRINADLANDLGNLAQRSLSMIARNCDGKIPEPGTFTDADKAILAAADGMYAKAREAMDRQAIKQYLDAVWAVVADANRYFAAEEPWAKGKTDPKRMATILYVTAEAVRQVAILAQPATPAAAGKLLDALGQGAGGAQLRGAGRGGPAAAGHAPSRRRPACSRAMWSRRPSRTKKGKPKGRA